MCMIHVLLLTYIIERQTATEQNTIERITKHYEERKHGNK